jgi:N-acetyl-anhydromuramyl-L-alanine amidase AmpD
MGIEYPPAKDMFVDESRTFVGANPRGAIVIHKTAGFDTPEQCAEYFANNPEKTSSHFIIGLDGSVVQCVYLDNGAAANCCLYGSYDGYWDQYNGVNLNTVTISIEHIDNHKDANGQYDNQGIVTEPQMIASINLCLWLKKNYDMQPQDVKTHASIDPVNRGRCPGNYDMVRLINEMSQTQNHIKQFNPNQFYYDMWRACIHDLMMPSGIYHAWQDYNNLHGRLNAPYTREYATIDKDTGEHIICQDGGNWHATWRNGQCELKVL